MHEFHLMREVVRTVERQLQGAGATRLSAVRLKVNALSHVLAHDHPVLHRAFALAARGTRAEGARLEIIPVTGDAWCPRCNRGVKVEGPGDSCSCCGGMMVAAQDTPEVMVHELVVEE
jgi:hydrogenase nickel incorporation protein HypA/HybF